MDTIPSSSGEDTTTALRCARRLELLALLTSVLALASTQAETCLSPFVKHLERPEQYLYVFCVD